MKRILFAITMLFAVASFAQGLVSVTCTKKAKVTISSTVFKLNPKFIAYAEPKGSNVVIQYRSATSAAYLTEYEVTDNIDSIYNRANRTGAHLVKLNKVTLVAGTTRDTMTAFLANIANIVEGKTATISGQPKARSQWLIEVASGTVKYNFRESRDTIQTKIDSIVDARNNQRFLDNRKTDSVWVTHGTHDTVWHKIQGNTTYDTIRRQTF